MARGCFAAAAVTWTAAVVLAGCQSPYRADQGALFGGLTGAGVGALVGEAVGDPLAGAAIGAGVGTVTGAAIGGSLDEIEARNRAAIESRLGRPVAAGAVTMADVVAMSQAGVDEQVIVNHVNLHGVAATPQTSDLIYLKQQGVGSRVIQAMQQPRTAAQVGYPESGVSPPPNVVVEEHYYGTPWHPGPFFRSRYRRHHRHRHGPGFHWGVSFSSPH